MHTAYRRDRWPELFNAAVMGNARFSPLPVGGSAIPTMYVATTQTVAFLETAFHEVHHIGTRIISERLRLATCGLVALTIPEPTPLIDLRDEALHRVGLARAQLVATTPEHYSCTREWAAALHRRRVGGVAPVGLLWRSRVAELAGANSLLLGDLLPRASDVCVLFGDRVSTAPAVWEPGDPHYGGLSAGDGRLLAEQIADQLGAVIVPN